MKLYFRDDDVLIGSSSHQDPLKRFKEVHSWFASDREKFVHVPTIIVEGLKEFPEAIGFIKEETAAGNMQPQLHGLKHIDYAKLSVPVIMYHLEVGRRWMIENLDVNPTKFYTPWGANAKHIYEAAEKVEFEVVDCSNISKPGKVLDALRQKYPLSFLDGKEIFFHWWEGGSRIQRIVACYQEGGYWEAKTKYPQMFD